MRQTVVIRLQETLIYLQKTPLSPMSSMSTESTTLAHSILMVSLTLLGLNPGSMESFSLIAGPTTGELARPWNTDSWEHDRYDVSLWFLPEEKDRRGLQLRPRMAPAWPSHWGRARTSRGPSLGPGGCGDSWGWTPWRGATRSSWWRRGGNSHWRLSETLSQTDCLFTENTSEEANNASLLDKCHLVVTCHCLSTSSWPEFVFCSNIFPIGTMWILNVYNFKR